MSSDDKLGIDVGDPDKVEFRNSDPDKVEFRNSDPTVPQIGGHADPQLRLNSRHGFIELAQADSVTDSDLRKISLEMDRIKSAKAEG